MLKNLLKRKGIKTDTFFQRLLLKNIKERRKLFNLGIVKMKLHFTVNSWVPRKIRNLS